MGWLFRSERGIGRGEVAESQLEAPFFALFMLVCAVGLFVFHVFIGNNSYTLAMAVSMLVFGATIVRVDFGIYILVIAMLLSPEIEAGTVGANQERGVNLRYDDILIIIIFIGILVKLAFEGRMQLWRNNPINAGIFSYYTVCIVSTLMAWRLSVPAWDKSVAFFIMLKMLEFYMIFFMVGLAINNMRDVQRQLVVFFGVSIVVCTYAILSIGTLDRVSAPFEAGGTEPNTLGGYLTVIMCVAGALAVYAPTRKLKLLLLAVPAIAMVPLVMTLSRASYMALLVGIAVLGIWGRKASVVAVLVILLVVAPFVLPQEAIDRIRYTFEPSGVPVKMVGTGQEVVIDKSTYERIYVWQKVRYNLGVWPWFGGGVSWDTVLDSQYARVLIETGLFGAATFLLLLYRILRTSRETLNWSWYWVSKGLGLGMIAATCALMVHGMGTISFLIVRIMEPFWFLLALTVVAREISIVDYQQRVDAYNRAQAQVEEAQLHAAQWGLERAAQ